MTGAAAGTHGLLLAAGSGSRMGTPKALVDDWLRRGVTTLRDGGCAEVTVVLGAAAQEARPLLDGLPVEVVVAEDWADGMGASLRAGLEALT
ncbi:NTP transferase domain-containing protein, partial [Nocardioides sp.]|uniref:nucleotidyltransferase family protein n=1 Tax=Nocardioides sp. TaxID=35761 RepID=UPI002732BDED